MSPSPPQRLASSKGVDEDQVLARQSLESARRHPDQHEQSRTDHDHQSAALENYEELLRLADRLGNAKTGLDRDLIRKLPSIRARHRYDKSQSWCVVCMTHFQEEDMVSCLLLS